MDNFSKTVTTKLRCYVYRLIDPRNGTTFHVGRGKGNRVFSHAADRLPATKGKDTENLKQETIRAIINAGLIVEHLIHRHGLDEKTAREVEAALIDAYPGLTNIQAGYGSSRGVMHAKQVTQLYEADEAVFNHRVMLFNVNRSSEERTPLDAVRHAWKASRQRAENSQYVLAVRQGLIIGAYVAEEWLPATRENFPGFPEVPTKRIGFRGREAPEDIKRMSIGKRYRNSSQNPVRYESPKR